MTGWGLGRCGAGGRTRAELDAGFGRGGWAGAGWGGRGCRRGWGGGRGWGRGMRLGRRGRRGELEAGADGPPTQRSWLRRQKELLNRQLAEARARLDALGSAQEVETKHE